MPGPIFRNPNSSPPPRRAKLARFEKTYYPEMKISDSESDEYVSTRHSGESSQKRGLKRQASSMNTLSPKPKRIKREEELPEIRRSPSVFFVEALENGASALTKVSRVYGLTEEGTLYPIPNEFKLNPKTRYVYRPYAEQIAENSHSRFPLRALNDSKHVIEMLADPEDRRYCLPGLQLIELEMTPATQDNFRNLFPRKSKGIIEKNIAKTQKHIQNLINRRSVSPPRYKQETLTRDKLSASDSKLENQQGVVATEDITGDGIQNLGFYQGSLMETIKERAKQKKQYGDRIIHYLRDVFWTDVNNQKHEGQINPLGEGGVMHLVNTSLKPTLWSDALSNWRGYLTTDWDRINVMCVEYTGLFQKKNGDRIRLPLTAYTVIPGKTILKGQEFRTGYGPLFEIRLNSELGLEKPIAVKQEPLSDTETIAGPSNPFKTKIASEASDSSLTSISSDSEDEIPLSKLLHQSSIKKALSRQSYSDRDYVSNSDYSSSLSSAEEDAFSESETRGRSTQITPLRNKDKRKELRRKQLTASTSSSFDSLASPKVRKGKFSQKGNWRPIHDNSRPTTPVGLNPNYASVFRQVRDHPGVATTLIPESSKLASTYDYLRHVNLALGRYNYRIKNTSRTTKQPQYRLHRSAQNQPVNQIWVPISDNSRPTTPIELNPNHASIFREVRDNPGIATTSIPEGITVSSKNYRYAVNQALKRDGYQIKNTSENTQESQFRLHRLSQHQSVDTEWLPIPDGSHPAIPIGLNPSYASIFREVRDNPGTATTSVPQDRKLTPNQYRKKANKALMPHGYRIKNSSGNDKQPQFRLHRLGHNGIVE